jgi:hypothetical protein
MISFSKFLDLYLKGVSKKLSFHYYFYILLSALLLSAVLGGFPLWGLHHLKVRVIYCQSKTPNHYRFNLSLRKDLSYKGAVKTAFANSPITPGKVPSENLGSFSITKVTSWAQDHKTEIGDQTQISSI